jgi:hypothetical protein
MEPRLLLSGAADSGLLPDLVATVDAVTIRQPAIPGDHASARLTIQNIGEGLAKGKVDVQVYLSASGLPGGELLVATLTGVRLNLEADGQRTIVPRFVLPLDFPAGTFNVTVRVDPAGRMAESDTGNNATVGQQAEEVVWQFGDVPGRGKTTLRLIGGGGLTVFHLSGGGWGEVGAPHDGMFASINANGTTSRTRLTVGGSASTDSVWTDGPMAAVIAPHLAIAGGVSIGGEIRRLVLGDVEMGEIGIQAVQTGQAHVRPVSITLGHVGTANLSTGDAGITSLRAQSWGNEDGGAGLIQSAWIGSLTVEPGPMGARLYLSGQGLPAGRRLLGTAKVGPVASCDWSIDGPVGTVRITGDVHDWGIVAASLGKLVTGQATTCGLDIAGRLGTFRAEGWDNGPIQADTIGSIRIAGGWIGSTTYGANLTVLGANASANQVVLGSVSIGGDLTNAAWQIGGAMHRLTVGGTVDSSTVRADGRMGALVLGATNHADFLAGIARAAVRFANGQADFVNTDATIGSIRVHGYAVQAGQDVPRFVNDTNFSAAGVGPVSLLNANGADTYHIYTLTGAGNGIASISYRDTADGYHWSWNPGTTPAPAGGTLVLDSTTNSRVTVTGDGTATVSGCVISGGTLSLLGATLIDASRTWDIAQPPAGTGMLQINHSGTLQLAPGGGTLAGGGIVGSGGTVVNGGALGTWGRLTVGDASGGGGTISVGPGGTSTIGGGTGTPFSFPALGASGGNVTLATGTLRIMDPNFLLQMVAHGQTFAILPGAHMIITSAPDVATWGAVLVDTGTTVRTYQATDTTTNETWTWQSNQTPPADLAGRSIEITALAAT